MSKDPRFDNDDFSPDWEDMGLDWLNDLDLEEPKEPEPVRQRPVETRRRPAEAPVEPRREQAGRPGRETAGTRRQPERAGRQPVERRQAQSGSRAADYERSRQTASPRQTGRVGKSDQPEYRSRRRKKNNFPLIAIIVVLVIGMGFAAWQLGSIFLNYSRDRSAYNELASRAISGLAEAEERGEPAASDEQEEEQAETVSEVPISVDWDYLRSVNSDIVGWLYCPDTVINYPVVQTSDHEFYLTHGFDGASNTSGTLFADMNSVEGIIQSNYIIYGHNMKDDSMFGTFQEYVNRSYYESHPTLYYLTPGASYRVDLFCAHIVEATEDNYPGYFRSTSDYQTYLNRVSSSSFWVNYDVISTDYQLITMSTCTSASGFSDPRLLVQGMLVPIQ